MTTDRQNLELAALLHELRSFPKETAWVEFKHNNSNPEEIGEYISALSNSAALEGKVQGWLVWGVDDATHDMIGTDFHYATAKVGNEELENWVLRLLNPRIQFRFYQFQLEDKTVAMLEICAAIGCNFYQSLLEYCALFRFEKLPIAIKDTLDKHRPRRTLLSFWLRAFAVAIAIFSLVCFIYGSLYSLVSLYENITNENSVPPWIISLFL